MAELLWNYRFFAIYLVIAGLLAFRLLRRKGAQVTKSFGAVMNYPGCCADCRRKGGKYVVRIYTPHCCKIYTIFWSIFHLAALSSLPCESTPASSALPAEKYPQNLMYILQQRRVYRAPRMFAGIEKKFKEILDCLI